MSKLTDFYSGQAVDAAGRKIEAIWLWDNEALEEAHDYIQWLFPTPTRSAFHPSAPVLTEEDIAAFRASEFLQDRLRQSFSRFVSFLGLAIELDLNQAKTSLSLGCILKKTRNPFGFCGV